MTKRAVINSLAFLYIFDNVKIATIPEIKLIKMKTNGSGTINPDSIIVTSRINNASLAS
jgi:hypothetical protein